MKNTRTRRLCLTVILMVVWGIALSTRAGAEGDIPKQLTFVSASPEDAPITQWGILVHTEALKRMGVEFLFKDLPAKRAGVSANTGEVDGEMGRVVDYDTMFPNLIRVEEHNRFITFSAFATDPTIALNGWDSLKDTAYKVEYRRGVKKCAERLPLVVAPDRLSEVNSIQQAIKRLLAGRTDIFVGVDFLMMRELNSPWFQDIRQKLEQKKDIHQIGLMEVTTVHTWLYKAHRELAPQLANVLRNMKAEGLFEVYREQVGIPPDELTW